MYIMSYVYDIIMWWSHDYSVGRPKHVKLMAGGLEGDTFIGPKAEVCLSLFQ